MRRALWVLPLAAVLVGGCVQNIDATRVGVPVTLASAAGTPMPPGGERFSVTGKAVYAFWGITAISGPELHRTLSGQLVGGKARRRPMPSGWGGGPVVVRGRESRSHGEGVQRVRSIKADRGVRW